MIEGIEYLGFLDLVLLPFFFAIIFVIAYFHKKKKIDENPLYKYYLGGLLVKIFGAIIFCLIYVFYYKGGDTIGFFDNAKGMGDLFFKEPMIFFQYFFGSFEYIKMYTWYYVDYCCQYCKEGEWTTAKFYVPFVIMGFKRYMITSMIVAWVSYMGVWRLLLVFSEQFPKMERRIVIAIIYIPSVVFWGSGILKDTITFTCACWYTFSVYNFFIKKTKRFKSAVIIVISAAIIITIKPYIMIALLPASVVWASYSYITNIKSKFLRTVVSPLLIIVGLGGGALILSLLSSKFQDYSSADKIMSKAKSTHDDLVRGDQYGNNYYDIGTVDNSASGMLKKAPMALIAGLFRPFLWDARNPVMLVSGLENFYILMLFLYILFRVGPFKMIKFIGGEPLLFFSFVFAMVFAFAVGLTTANYGALVRYRIPELPFFVASLFVLLDKVQSYKLEQKKEKEG